MYPLPASLTMQVQAQTSTLEQFTLGFDYSEIVNIAADQSVYFYSSSLANMRTFILMCKHQINQYDLIKRRVTAHSDFFVSIYPQYKSREATVIHARLLSTRLLRDLHNAAVYIDRRDTFTINTAQRSAIMEAALNNCRIMVTI